MFGGMYYCEARLPCVPLGPSPGSPRVGAPSSTKPAPLLIQVEEVHALAVLKVQRVQECERLQHNPRAARHITFHAASTNQKCIKHSSATIWCKPPFSAPQLPAGLKQLIARHAFGRMHQGLNRKFITHNSAFGPETREQLHPPRANPDI